MINTAAGVIFDKDEFGTRPRSDKTGYTYTGRSYGVGASSGLFSDFSDDFQPSSVQYQEVGYNASILCGFNTSSQWAISQFVDEAQSSNQLIPNVYLAGGATPDQELYWQLQYSAVDDSNVVSINAHPDLGSTGNGTVVIATGNGSYSSLNQTQCSVTFIPTLFDVGVDLSSHEITVTKAGHAQDMDPSAQTNATFTAWKCQSLPTSLDSLSFNSNDISGCSTYTAHGQPGLGNIATRALRQLNDLSTLDTSLHQSELGEMFLSLVENEILYYAKTLLNISDFMRLDFTNPETSNNATIKEYSIEQGLKSLIDNSLLAFASAQLVLNYNTSSNPTNGTLTISAVQVGTTGFVYSLFVFHVVLILIYLEEMFRTRFWAALLLFDLNDLKSVLIARFTDGTGLVNKTVASPSAKNDSMWGTISKDRTVDKLRVRLVQRSLGLIIGE